jgi:capsular exopolysaccharide synthesis family protein
MLKKKRNLSKPKAVSLIAADSSSIISEQYRMIRMNVAYTSEMNHKIKTIVVSSAGPGEGKSTICANLAVTFAQNDKRVLLVDADMRRPTVYLTFGLENFEGLSSYLRDDSELDSIIKKSTIKNLDVITSSIKPINSSDLLSSKKMDRFIKEVSYLYDYVFFDTPPLFGIPDGSILSTKTDGMLLVVRENVTNKEQLIRTKEALELTNVNVLGVIYNGVEDDVYAGYYY